MHLIDRARAAHSIGVDVRMDRARVLYKGSARDLLAAELASVGCTEIATRPIESNRVIQLVVRVERFTEGEIAPTISFSVLRSEPGSTR
jgi:hypothetical protein